MKGKKALYTLFRSFISQELCLIYTDSELVESENMTIFLIEDGVYEKNQNFFQFKLF